MKTVKNIVSTALFVRQLVWKNDRIVIVKLLAVFFVMLAMIVLNVSVPLILREILNVLSLKESSLYMTFMLVGYGLFWFFSQIAAQIRSYLVSNLLEELIGNFNISFFDHLHRLSLSFHAGRASGATSHSIMRASQGIESLFWGLILFMVPTVFEITLAVGVIVYLYGILYGSIMACILFGYCLVSIIGLEKSQKAQEVHSEKRSAAQAFMLDSLLNVETVKYFSNEELELENCKKVINEHKMAANLAYKQMMRAQLLQSCIVGLGLICMTWLAGSAVISSQLSLSDFVLINTYILQFVVPLSYFGYVIQQVRKGFVDVKEALEIMELMPVIVDAPNAIGIVRQPFSLRFERVSFAYDTKRAIIHEISFNIEPGKTVAIVGPTGSGKSTIARLLVRLYDVDSGAVFVQGHDIRLVTQKSLHAHITVVSQDPALFNNTIYYNIAYGNPLATTQEIGEAVSRAQLDSFIAQLPDGLETIVGERGFLLSGGEKQRIALARALLKKSLVYVFDEATSALDMTTERKVINALCEHDQSSTKIIIAHRLSAVIKADEILVMNHGRIVERGTHKDLLHMNGLYHSLWQEQAQAEESILYQKKNTLTYDHP